MYPQQDRYPFFEVNQVLSDLQLNQVFDYLDEQERLTRANLIGVGIVCGLEVSLKEVDNKKTLYLSKGCGVTSEGYLILEPGDVALVSYRKYTLPPELDYPRFKDDNSTQYELWEMFPDSEPNSKLLGDSPNFLNDKAVLLFLELNKQPLRNCSPNDCNDKGSGVTATLRRLLIEKKSLEKIIAKVNGLAANLTSDDLEAALSARLSLPDLRLPRYDVPNTYPVTSNDVLAAFHSVFHTTKLASAAQDALTKVYEAFKPLIQNIYPSNPFTDFSARFGFLDTIPTTDIQVRFLQYYYDFFDDLLKAYDEFRFKGLELMCACCPPDSLFPRHLMLGLLESAPTNPPGIYRHQFLASSAICNCGERIKELQLLFQRLVEMIRSFSNEPPLSQPTIDSYTDKRIHVTPSKLADVPLSDKAIPYYYLQDGEPPLYKLWNPEKSRRNRANQNLSYRSDEYQPAALDFDFVIDPLRYDLEPYNFLRIEGHLGQDYLAVLKTLLVMKKKYRLPIEVIALRTGIFDENISVDLSKEDCRFEDLETLYDTLREEFLCALSESVMYFYAGPNKRPDLDDGIPQLPLLKKYAPSFRYGKNTFGSWYERSLKFFQSVRYIDFDPMSLQDLIGYLEYFKRLLIRQGVPEEFPDFPFILIYHLTKIAETLPENMNTLDFEDFKNKYTNLVVLIRFFKRGFVDASNGERNTLQEDVVDQLDQLLFTCKLDPIKVVYQDFVRRIREVKQQQFLSFFLQKHPGIQHKAGVPLGGTFIIVYHEKPNMVLGTRPPSEWPSGSATPSERPPVGASVDRASGTERPPELLAGTVGISPDVHSLPRTRYKINKISAAFDRIRINRQLTSNPDIRFLLGAFTGQVPDLSITPRPSVNEEAEKIIGKTIDELTEGTVIADFYLPYMLCSDCAPVQYVLPQPSLGLRVELGCTDEDGKAEATLVPLGGKQPYTYRIGNQTSQPLTGKVILTAGTHTLVIRDSIGTESAPQSVTVPEPLTIGTAEYEKVTDTTYQVKFTISGGTPPYAGTSGTIVGATYLSDPVESGKKVKIKISDSVKCSTDKEFEYTVSSCDLPCNGIALRCGYRFWIPDPDPKRPYTAYKAEVQEFMFEPPPGVTIDFDRLRDEIENNIQAPVVDDLNDPRVFDGLIEDWLGSINGLISQETGDDDWLRLKYEKPSDESASILWIEFFKCHKFTFNIRAVFVRRDIDEIWDVKYTHEGTEIILSGDRPSVTIPRFDCIEIDKCDPNHPEKDYCKEVDLRLDISQAAITTNREYSLEAKASGNDKPIAYLWEVQDANPAMSNEEKARFTFSDLGSGVKDIRLIAYTEKGCRVMQTSRIIFEM